MLHQPTVCIYKLYFMDSPRPCLLYAVLDDIKSLAPASVHPIIWQIYPTLDACEERQF